MSRSAMISVGLLLAALGGVDGREDRNTRVRRDRKEFEDDRYWIYNDLERGTALARKTGKPLLVVFR